jgi:hypothetical protein
MDNHPMQDRDIEDVELAERLEAYAEARLSPSLSATSRMRAQVMAAAQRQAALAAAELASRRRVVHGTRWRRPVAALLAAALTLGLAVGSVAAARPGGPLYGARIWAETLTLPTSVADRAGAEVRRLNDRLAEAAAATTAGDTNAADAALAAYNSILAEATAGTHGDAVANAALDTAVRRNIEVLTALLKRVPTQAQDAIQHAIDQSGSAANGLHGQPGVGGPRSSNPGNGPAATNNPGRTANPNKPTPEPANATTKPHENATPKPHENATPKPHVTPEPVAVTPAPQHTPRSSGRPSSPPGNG